MEHFAPLVDDHQVRGVAIRVSAFQPYLFSLIAIERNAPVMREKIMSFPNEDLAVQGQIEPCSRAVVRRVYGNLHREVEIHRKTTPIYRRLVRCALYEESEFILEVDHWDLSR